MLNKTQILKRIRYLYERKYKFCVAIKAVINKEDGTENNGEELRLVPVIIDTAEQFDYTMRFCKVMIEKDGRELIPFSADKLKYIAIIGANSEEEGNKKIRAVIANYSREKGYGKVMGGEELKGVVAECVAESEQTDGTDNQTN